MQYVATYNLVVAMNIFVIVIQVFPKALSPFEKKTFSAERILRKVAFIERHNHSKQTMAPPNDSKVLTLRVENRRKLDSLLNTLDGLLDNFPPDESLRSDVDPCGAVRLTALLDDLSDGGSRSEEAGE